MGSILSLLSPTIVAPGQAENQSSTLLNATPLKALGDISALQDKFTQMLTASVQSTDKAPAVNIQKLQPSTPTETLAESLDTKLMQDFVLEADDVAHVDAAEIAVPVVLPNVKVEKIAPQFPVKEVQQKLVASTEVKASSGMVNVMAENAAATATTAATVPSNSASVAKAPPHPAAGAKNMDEALRQMMTDWSMQGGEGEFVPDESMGFRIVKAGDSFSILAGEATDDTDTNAAVQAMLDLSIAGGMQDYTPYAIYAPTQAAAAPEPLDVSDVDGFDIDALSDDTSAPSGDVSKPVGFSLPAANNDNSSNFSDDGQQGAVPLPKGMGLASNTDDASAPTNSSKPDLSFVDELAVQNTHSTQHASASRAVNDIDTAQTTARAQTPPPVHDQVHVKIRQAVSEGHDEVTIRLDPPQLGRVDVKMDIRHDGQTQVVFNVEQKETLELLRQDIRGLERALNEAGLKTSGSNLEFNLRQDQNFAGNKQQGDGQHTPSGYRNDETGTLDASETSMNNTNIKERNVMLTVSDGLNIQV